MKDRLPCEFFLLRYVPDPVKGEFTNIGVLLREVAPHSAAPQNTQLRFTRDWSRVRCMDPDADIALLEAMEDEIAARLKLGAADTKPIFTVMEETFSNSIQMSEPRACLAESVATELELLMQIYVEPLKVKREPKRTGRAAIVRGMRTQFERAGVWPLMRKQIAASLYTLPGDPMKIDCGYKPNGVIKMFHAVSLESDVESAKVLAYSTSRLREGVARIEEATLELTAVIEPLRALSDEVESTERYRFGVETMESQQIRVVTVNDLARIAETARADLRL